MWYALVVLVWVFESNLIWSARLAKTLKALGHEALVLDSLPDEGSADVAIVNLASPDTPAMIEALRLRGVYSIGHAGHKEKDLLELGRDAGCDAVATNSELTFKLDRLLERASIQ